MNKAINTRDTILDEAIFMASTTGFEALTIGKLASAVGMSKSGLFAHFNSKEQLQVDLLKAVAKKFAEIVITPALKVANGEPRIRSFAKNLLDWDSAEFMPGGCLLFTAAGEFDDKPGPARDFLIYNQNFWLDYVKETVNDAIKMGQFRNDLDTEQFPHEFQAIFLSFHYTSHLLKDPHAESRALKMLDKLLDDARV